MDLLEIFKSSILYIEDHLTESISVKDVARQASVSNFYFQRMFSAFTGMNVGDYIRQRRLSLAAQELLIDDVKIIDLAYKYGYETPESFARAFRKFHGVLPKEVKKHPNLLKLCPRLEIIVSVKGGKTMDYKITQRDAFKITLLIKKFKDDTSTKDIPKFWDEYWKKGYGKDVCPMYDCCINEKKLPHCGKCDDLPCEIHYSMQDPSTTKEEHEAGMRERVEKLRNLPS